MSFNLNRWIFDILGATFTTAPASYLIYGRSVGADNTVGSHQIKQLDFAH